MGELLISTNDNGLYLHQPTYCTLKKVTAGKPDGFALWARPTQEGGVHLYPSRLGWVAMVYEERRADGVLGRMTFFVQVNEEKCAWQRIEWPAGFSKWGDRRVQAAIENFLVVAERWVAEG